MSARATRREVFGASVAMLVVGAAEAGSAKAAELDGELLAACARFHWLEGEYGRLCRLTDWPLNHIMTPAEEALQARFDAIAEQQRELGERLAEAKPRTPEGLRAKARATLAYMNDDPSKDDENLSGMIGRLERSIIRDVADRART
jgi:hypothetical protein